MYIVNHLCVSAVKMTVLQPFENIPELYQGTVLVPLSYAFQSYG